MRSVNGRPSSRTIFTGVAPRVTSTRDPGGNAAVRRPSQSSTAADPVAVTSIATWLSGETTIPELRCQAVVGSANNQLAEPSCALQICQAKMAEVISGVLPLESQDETAYDDVADSPWRWSLECEQGDVSGVWNVTVHALRGRPDGIS